MIRHQNVNLNCTLLEFQAGEIQLQISNFCLGLKFTLQQGEFIGALKHRDLEIFQAHSFVIESKQKF